ENTIKPVLGCTCGTHLRAYCCGCRGQAKRRSDGECSCRSLGNEWSSLYEVNHPAPPTASKSKPPVWLWVVAIIFALIIWRSLSQSTTHSGEPCGHTTNAGCLDNK